MLRALVGTDGMVGRLVARARHYVSGVRESEVPGSRQWCLSCKEWVTQAARRLGARI